MNNAVQIRELKNADIAKQKANQTLDAIISRNRGGVFLVDGGIGRVCLFLQDRKMHRWTNWKYDGLFTIENATGIPLDLLMQAPEGVARLVWIDTGNKQKTLDILAGSVQKSKELSPQIRKNLNMQSLGAEADTASFWENHKNKFYIGGGIAMLTGVAFFGYRAVKAKMNDSNK